MRLLLTTYHQAFLSPGGGETELRQIADYISDIGVRADLYGPSAKRLSFYDAVIHFSAHGGGELLLAEVKAAAKPVILVPNFNFFDRDHTSHEVVQRHLDLANLIILRTNVEKELCLQSFDVASDKIAVVPVGIDPSFGNLAEEGLFNAAYGLDRYILWVGQIARHKHQLDAIEALKDSELPLVFIGGYIDAERNYYDRCRAAAHDNVRFLPYMQPGSEVIRSAMQSCSAYIELGDDYPGSSAMEAALAGCTLVINDHPWSREVFGDVPNYVQSDHADDLRACIADALTAPRVGRLVDRMRQHHLQPAPTRKLVELISDLLSVK